jgi:ribosome-binding protein aMBF1 (putative translation factor)
MNEPANLIMNAYLRLRSEIDRVLKTIRPNATDQYIDFDPTNYVNNPIVLARISAGLSQAELAARAGVTQAYVSKIERQEAVSPKVILKFNAAFKVKPKVAPKTIPQRKKT